MHQHLERLLPVLSTIPGVNIPASLLQSVSVAASQQKIDPKWERKRRQLRKSTGQRGAGATKRPSQKSLKKSQKELRWRRLARAFVFLPH